MSISFILIGNTDDTLFSQRDVVREHHIRNISTTTDGRGESVLLPNFLVRLEIQIFESQNVSITAVVKFEDTCQVMKI
jgi:hypothetical protein